MHEKIVCCSGGMDPVHFGHIEYLEAAAKFGKLIVILNSDEWLIRKKGYNFMSFIERKKIIEALRCVSSVVSVDDSDNTVCKALAQIRPDYFAKGGDRGKDNTPEVEQCGLLGIEMLFGIGGDDKVQASSRLVEQAIQSKLINRGIINGV